MNYSVYAKHRSGGIHIVLSADFSSFTKYSDTLGHEFTLLKLKKGNMLANGRIHC